MDNGFNGLSSNGKNNILYETVIFLKNVATINSSYLNQKKPHEVYMVFYKSLITFQQN